MTEYIALQKYQCDYIKKMLLYCQMEALTSLKNYQNYKKLRKQELAVKKILKSKMNDINNEIENVDLLLPKTKSEVFKPVEISKSSKRHKDIEVEIEAIRRKIAELQ